MKNWTLITGASEGLGKEFARIAGKAGRNLILTARSEDKLNALAEELRTTAGEVVVIPADLSDMAEADRLWTEATKGRRIDILVNNAGLGSHGDFASDATWDRELTSINVNILSYTLLMKRAIPHMKAHKAGRILNVASVAAFTPGPNMAVYHATKAYALHLSEAVAEELRGTNVTVTALCPGATDTEFFGPADMDGVRLLKMGKPMVAAEVAKMAWGAMLGGKSLIVTGLLNKVLAFLPRITPRFVTTFVTSKIMGKAR